MKGTGIAHPVQGLICPHGYSNAELRLYPVEGVYVSMAALQTRTTIEIFACPGQNRVTINGQPAAPQVSERVESFLKRFRDLISPTWHFRITSVSNFATNAGLGSSSSAFAALTLAIDQALATRFSRQDLSILARHGSCSAAGSVVGGVSVLRSGTTDSDGYAERLLDPEAFPFSILIVKHHSAKSSEEAHQQAISSPLFEAATVATRDISNRLQRALINQNWLAIGSLAERYLYLSYAVIMTGDDNLLLWSPETIRVFNLLRKCRDQLGIRFFFAMNTGSNVYVYVPTTGDVPRLRKALVNEGFETDVSSIGGPAQGSKEHLP